VGRSWPFLALGLATALATMLPWADRSLPNYGSYFLLGIAAFRWHGEIGSRIVNGAVAGLAVFALGREDGVASACAALLPLALLALPIAVPRWSRFLGDISYSLYLFHLMTGTTFLVALESFPLSPGVRAALVLVALAISVGTAALAFRWIESPAMRWAKRFSYRPSTTGAKALPIGAIVPQVAP